jgi:transposase, IS5 family
LYPSLFASFLTEATTSLTQGGVLLRELQRKLPDSILEREKERFSQYEQVLSQKINDKNKIYSLHEPDIYCVGKGKDHKPYEYGRKASIVSTLNSKIIVGVVSHDEHTHDSKTLISALAVANRMRSEPISTAVVDRGYRGAKKQNSLEIILPSPPLKRDTEVEINRKRTLCRRRSGIEPIIGHLKQEYRLTRNWLKGSVGDSINLFMAACAWNLRKWMAIFFVFESNGRIVVLAMVVHQQQYGTIVCLQLNLL